MSGEYTESSALIPSQSQPSFATSSSETELIEMDSKSYLSPGVGSTMLISDLYPDPLPVPAEDTYQTAPEGVSAPSVSIQVGIQPAPQENCWIAAQIAGPWTPISLVLVAILLYLFRGVYSEVGSALPLNGGTYTLLLNTTSKPLAAAAACLTLLSYMATAVVSGASAMQYLQSIWPGLNVFWATIVLLCIFAALNLIGLTESAGVALAIFVTHLAVLVALIVAGIVQFARDPSLLVANFRTPWLSPPLSIVFGFCSALLGISGFESSANYIEEQREGVFPKTLRNMWIAVAILNPSISFLSWCVLPASAIIDPALSASLLSRMAAVVGGNPLKYIVVIDATMVLSGALLTSFVGVGGLMRRMSSDRVLPRFLLQTNRLRNTNHWIILLFLGICVSVFALVNGDVTVLSVVYTICFLAVMSLFALGNMLLKYKRGSMPVATRSWWITVLIAWLMVVTGLVVNIVMSLTAFGYFALYYFCTLLVVGSMFLRVQVLKMLLYFGRLFLKLKCFPASARMRFVTKMQEWIVKQGRFRVIFFAKTDALDVINKAILYCRENELTNNIAFVHFYQQEGSVPKDLESNVRMLNKAYPKYKLDVVLVKGRFNRDAVDRLSERLAVPRNFMFMTSYSSKFEHNIGVLGGVRVITQA